MKKILISILVVAILLASFAGAEVIWDSTGGSFTITVNYPVCDDSGKFFTDYSTSPPTDLPTIGLSPPADCDNPAAKDHTKCCPSGTECQITAKQAPSGKILWNCFTTGIDFCWNYTDASSCNNDTAGVAKKSVESLFNVKQGQELGWWKNASGKDCVSVARRFRCAWDATTTPKCTPAYGNDSICEGETDFTENDNCMVTSLNTVDNCATTEFLDVSWVASWQGGGTSEECGPGSKKIPCGDVTKLTFFSWINIIAGIVIIIIVYYFYASSKRKL